MNERLKKLRKTLDLTQQEFADRIGIARGNIGAYEVGKNSPSDAVISLICKTEFPNGKVNEDWLRTGNGEMFEQMTEQEKIMKYTALLLNDKDSAIASAIQTLIVTYEQLDDSSKATLEKIALQYIDNLKKSQ